MNEDDGSGRHRQLSDHHDAASIASEAGRLLLGLRRVLESSERSADSVRDEADRRSHEFISKELAGAHPGDAVLSEEAPDDMARLRSARVWIVDPLDGTREFGEPGRQDWAVHIALVVEGVPVAGAVALPARGLTLSTDTVASTPSPALPGAPRLVVSRTRPARMATTVAGRLGATTLAMGSAGAKAMAVVLGEADVYLHDGGQYEWDSAAPVAVAAAAGLHVSRLDGSPLQYNRPNPWLPDLLICRPELAPTILEATEQRR